MTRKSAKKQPPKIVQSGHGRNPVDWQALFTEWQRTNSPIKDFLEEYGLSLKSSKTRAMVSGWRRGEREARQRMRHVEKQLSTNKVEPSGLWQIVQQWRQGQADTDYKTANGIRQHINAILSRSVVTTPDGKTESKLSPRDLTNLADAAATIQKIQRLALGMSTDNIGVPQPDEGSHVDHSDDVNDCPIFLVEVNDNGKFRRARPKQVN